MSICCWQNNPEFLNMPLFFQQDIDADTRLAIWKIEEDEPFFLASVPLQRNITHPHKRLQHLAGRYLLRLLFPQFPIELIQVADTRKPYLEDEAFHFSISHCSDYAAVIVSKTRRVGIDIELVTDKVARVQHKFVGDGEREVVNSEWSIVNNKENEDLFQNTTSHAQLILLWSCKEAVYKWYGRGNMDFKKHMQAVGLITKGSKSYAVKMVVKKNEDQWLDLHSCFFDDLCMSYVVT